MNKIYLLALTFLTINSFSQNGGFPTELTIEVPVAMCSPGDCANLTANFTDVKLTSSYQVESINYAPFYVFEGGTFLNASSDDKWTQVINMPFPFCFYGQNYNKLLVGSNGVVTFDISNIVTGGTQNPGGICEWIFNGTIPNQAFPIKNAIYGVYQDTDIGTPPVTNPSLQNVNYYVAGSAPNRAFIINFNKLPQFSCNDSVGLQTSQIILYETTNIVDVLISNRSACTTWNSGNGVVGIQNQAGTIATVPPGRNTGNWSAVNEAWRFSPNGDSNTTFFWNLNGTFYSNNNPVNVCPTDGDVLQAVVKYSDCNAGETILTEDIVMHIETPINNPLNLSLCASDSNPGIFDLTQNNTVMLNGQNPIDFEIKYYTSLSDAVSNSNFIVNPQSFSSMGQTIFSSIQNMNTTGCYIVKSFDLIRNQVPEAPVGDSIQNFIDGETLADIELTGSNIVWYSDEFGQTELPNTTLLTDGTTYYAAQRDSGCVSGKSSLANPGRLAVTVYNVLSTDSFDVNSFKMYPNPVKDILNLSYSKEISKVSVTNLLGQEIFVKSINATQSQIDLSKLSRGTYLLKINSNNQNKTVKIIKQ